MRKTDGEREREREELVGHALPFCVSGVSLSGKKEKEKKKKTKTTDESESQKVKYRWITIQLTLHHPG